MATKKSGKSVIINSFLQKEYAPTSLTLPTPNAIIYEGWDKDYIELKIESDPKIKGYEKEQIFKFHSHEETREKIDSLFREAKIDDESSYKIPDMHLKLPQHLDYIIIDTPGPDLAGAEHKSIADKWMKEADAIIFASDFSKHLTNDEIKFLKDIRETLAKYDKFHSLIFTINKIDMRYQDSENKSIVKFVDFFRRRLEEMEYKGIPVMATSALEYFNVFELKRVLAKYNIKEEINYKKFDSILDELSDNSDDDLDTSEETIIDNVEGNLRKLKRFVKIKNPDLDDLIAESGMPLLLKRTDYIAKTKANVEIFKHLFRKIDSELSAIKNEFLIKEVKRLQSQKTELLEDIESIGEFFTKKKGEIDNYFKDDSLKKVVKKSLIKGFDEINSKAKAAIATEFQTIEDKVMINKLHSFEVNSKEVIDHVEPILKAEIVNSINRINREKNSYIRQIDTFTKDINSEILKFIESKKFKEKYDLDLSFPTLDPALKQSSFRIDWESVFEKSISNPKVKIDSRSEKKKTIDHGCGFLCWRKLFGKRYEKVTVSYFDKEKTHNGLRNTRNKLEKELQKNINNAKNKSIEKINKQLEKFAAIVKKQANGLLDSYRETNEWLKINLVDDIEKVEKLTKLFSTIEIEFNDVYKTWTSIKGEK